MTQSPGWGTVAKKETLASHPELKSNAEGESKNVLNRSSSAVCSVEVPESSLEPVEPSIRGDAARLRMKDDRKEGESVMER